jgi:hypothetical protein
MHVDELLGVATIAAAAMFAAIAAQPTMNGAACAGETPVATAAAPAAAVPIVRLPSIEVVARRSVELARIEREESASQPY